MSQRSPSPQQARATRLYRWLMYAYPLAHRRSFGSAMLQTFADHYRDAIETHHERLLWFWLGVASDTSRSLLHEYRVALGDALAERIPPMKSALPVLAATLGVLVLLGLRVLWYPAVLSAPHGGGSASSSVIGVAILALVYLVATLVVVRLAPQPAQMDRAAVLRRAALVGALVGVVALGAIATDTLAQPESALSVGAWSLVGVAALAAWGWVGVMAARVGGSWRLGVVAALWRGMVSALVGAAGEVVSTLLALPRLAQNELSNADYLYWHQPDIQSYAIASALALSMIGLILAPIVASLIGGIGSWLAVAGGSQRD